MFSSSICEILRNRQTNKHPTCDINIYESKFMPINCPYPYIVWKLSALFYAQDFVVCLKLWLGMDTQLLYMCVPSSHTHKHRNKIKCKLKKYIWLDIIISTIHNSIFLSLAKDFDNYWIFEENFI